MQKVSIITMTYNDCEHLQKSIDRILAQDYENIEYVLVDGGSTDGTMEVIKATAQKLGDRMKWVSEPDRGLYDALNKGIAMSTGDIVGIMNDEFTTNDAISKMVAAIEREGADGVHADVNYVNGDKIIRKWRMGEGTIQGGWMPSHPTFYLKREVYEKYGDYKIDYRIAADYELMIRLLYHKKIKLAYINEVLVQMFHGENSTSTGGFKNYLESFAEGLRALRENHVRFAFIVNCIRTVRVLLEFL